MKLDEYCIKLKLDNGRVLRTFYDSRGNLTRGIDLKLDVNDISNIQSLTYNGVTYSKSNKNLLVKKVYLCLSSSSNVESSKSTPEA